MIYFLQGTMTDTDLPAESFGAIIDKALFDSLLCTETGSVTVAQYIFEVSNLINQFISSQFQMFYCFLEGGEIA